MILAALRELIRKSLEKRRCFRVVIDKQVVNQRFVRLAPDEGPELVVAQAQVWHAEEEKSVAGFGKVGDGITTSSASANKCL